MKKIVCLIFLLFMCAGSTCAKVEVSFTPSKSCENSIVSLINKSRYKIDIAVYSINNDQIVRALKKAHDRGVKIRILTDRLQAAGKSSKVLDLYRYGINIRVHSKNKIEHNKFAVFDEKTATTGSYNWTNPASVKNSENCLFLTDNKDIIEKYNNRFKYLWQINTKFASDKWFERKNG